MSTGDSKEVGESPATPWAFGALLLIAGGLAVAFSMSMRVSGFTDVHDPGPDALPQLMGYALIAGGLVQLVSSALKKTAPMASPANSKDSRCCWSGGLVLAQVCAYVALLPILGFVLATLGFAIGLLGWLGVSWKLSAAVAVGLVVIVSVLFTHVFEVILPAGILF
ncbi:MAG: tripartite tricarboxylate transporter TctB family protein [Verrucomicrobiae bacterium]|nr:tripartite tricarboxylate transporter TctB family protein [Verrucomicrobiae bacterium]